MSGITLQNYAASIKFVGFLVIWVLFLMKQLGPKGAEQIADCLKYNKTISILDLRANGLGDDVGSIIEYKWILRHVVGFFLMI